MFRNKGEFPLLPLPSFLIMKVAHFHPRKDEVGVPPTPKVQPPDRRHEEVALLLPLPRLCRSLPESGLSLAGGSFSLRNMHPRCPLTLPTRPASPRGGWGDGYHGTLCWVSQLMPLGWGAAPWPRDPLSPIPPPPPRDLMRLIGPSSSGPTSSLGWQPCHTVFSLRTPSFARAPLHVPTSQRSPCRPTGLPGWPCEQHGLHT